MHPAVYRRVIYADGHWSAVWLRLSSLSLY